MSVSSTSYSESMECSRCKTVFEQGYMYCAECGFKVNKKPLTKGRYMHKNPEYSFKNSSYSVPLKDGFIHQRQHPSVSMRMSSSERIRSEARKRVEDKPKRKTPVPPRSKPPTNILKNAELLLVDGKKSLANSKKRRAKQERVISYLEENNLYKLKSQLPPKERNLVDLSTVANPNSIADVKPQFINYEQYMNPLSYTEWHLKTAHGIRREAERIYPRQPGEVKDEEYFARTRWSTPQSRGYANSVTVKSLCPIVVAPGTPLTGPQSIPNHLTVPNPHVQYGFPLLSERKPVFTPVQSKGKSKREESSPREGYRDINRDSSEEVTTPSTCNIYWRGDPKADLVRDSAAKTQSRERDDALVSTNHDKVKGKTNSVMKSGPDDEEEVEFNHRHETLLHRTLTDEVDDEYTSDDHIFNMKQRIKLESIKLKETLSGFLTPRSSQAQTAFLEKLKLDILSHDIEERKFRKERKQVKLECEIKMSKATLAVADLQCIVSKEHGNLVKIEDKLVQVRKVDDEFSQRSPEAVTEEEELRKQQQHCSDLIIDLEAKLATSLAVEARVHRECEAQMHQSKTREFASNIGKLQAIRDHEDAVCSMSERVRHLAAHRIQAAFRVMMQRANIVVVFDEEEKRSDGAAKLIQSKVRTWYTKRQIRDIAMQRYEKHYDRESGYFFYTDSHTGESQWSKPKIFGDEDIELTDIYTKKKHVRGMEGEADDAMQQKEKTRSKKRKSRRKKTTTVLVSSHEAALAIQRCYRGHKGRLYVKELVMNRFEKLYDEDSGCYYYWDTVLETSQWHKPKVLGPYDDIEVEL